MNTKQIISFIIVAFMGISATKAQLITVVSETNTTSIYRTLQEAIEGANDGCIIYLPGGGFTIADSVMITKKVNIVGIGHKTINENVDGTTIINGNLYFSEGSSGSAVMGCYISGNINIGVGNTTVNDVTIKYCNLNSVQVKHEGIHGTYVSQNYIRSICNFSNSSCTIKNNVIHSIMNVRDGFIYYNTICNSHGGRDDDYSLCDIHSSQIYYNVLKGRGLSSNYYGFWNPFRGDNCDTKNNLVVGDNYGKTFGDFPITINAQGSDCFVNVENGYSWWTISSKSNYHFKDEYKEYENQVGIYAGNGFSEDQLAPVPYIVSKSIPEQTDAAGKLYIKVRVKAGD